MLSKGGDLLVLWYPIIKYITIKFLSLSFLPNHHPQTHPRLSHPQAVLVIEVGCRRRRRRRATGCWNVVLPKPMVVAVATQVVIEATNPTKLAMRSGISSTITASPRRRSSAAPTASTFYYSTPDAWVYMEILEKERGGKVEFGEGGCATTR